eukprot:TRINITY_DN1008_c0_g6_i1.p2 TRINITY_DN1008_c0_g6~~TRINITY_DN1008_c0_g6_i1.p2  ORF type:complete len:59 (-),score=5.15 TRINITY_DN1008_c0_g6_i1:244-420(-)
MKKSSGKFGCAFCRTSKLYSFLATYIKSGIYLVLDDLTFINLGSFEAVIIPSLTKLMH